MSKDGHAAVNFEHAWGDGVAVLRYVQDIYKDSRENAFVSPGTKPYDDDIQNVTRLGNIYYYKILIDCKLKILKDLLILSLIHDLYSYKNASVVF